MQSDDLYPSDGTFFGGVPPEPLDQAIARKAERAKTLEALPILKELANQLEADIAFYQSVKSIPDEVKADPDKFLIVHNANELVSDVLLAKKEWIESLMDTNKPN